MADFPAQDRDPFVTGSVVVTTRDFQAAADDTAITVSDLNTSTGRRGVAAADAPDGYSLSLVSVWDGVVLTDSGGGSSAFLSEITILNDVVEGRVPPLSIEEILVGSGDDQFVSINLEEILIGNGAVSSTVSDITPCGAPEDSTVGTPCLDLATSKDVFPEGVHEDSTVGTPCIDVTSVLTAPPPVVTFIDPPLGQAVYRYRKIVFTVTNENGIPLRRILVKAVFKDHPGWSFVYDGGPPAPPDYRDFGIGFGPDYQGAINQRRIITNGYEFTVLMDGGWPHPVRLEVFAINALGAEA